MNTDKHEHKILTNLIISLVGFLLTHININVPFTLLYPPLFSSLFSFLSSLSLLSSSFIFLKDHHGKSTVLLGRHGSVSLCRDERENKMAATYNVLAFKR